ncbi:MAG: sulfotransferase, partial [Candidatus Sulfotelmatobacter sp.]
MLYALLNKHPQVALMFEADLLLLRPVFLKPARICDWTQRWEFWNQTFSRHGLDPTEFAGVLPEFRSVFETVHQEYARRKNAVIWGDKSPNYHDQLLRMAKDFPHARFIIVWRSPLEMIGATLRAAATGSRYFRKRGMPWRSLLGYRAFKGQCSQIISAGAAVHQLHYEDLVSDTAAVMQKVCMFLDIPYDHRICTLEGADRSAVYAGRHHNLLRENDIVAGPRRDVIEPSLRRRVMRYVNLWRQID